MQCGEIKSENTGGKASRFDYQLEDLDTMRELDEWKALYTFSSSQSRGISFSCEDIAVADIARVISKTCW